MQTSLPVPTFKVTAIPHPLRECREQFSLGHGCSVEDAIIYSCERAGAPVSLMYDGVAIIGDIKIPKAQWATTYPQPGEHVIVKALPGGKIGSILTQAALIGAMLVPGIRELSIGLRFAIAAAIPAVGTLPPSLAHRP